MAFVDPRYCTIILLVISSNWLPISSFEKTLSPLQDIKDVLTSSWESLTNKVTTTIADVSGIQTLGQILDSAIEEDCEQQPCPKGLNIKIRSRERNKGKCFLILVKFPYCLFLVKDVR